MTRTALRLLCAACLAMASGCHGARTARRQHNLQATCAAISRLEGRRTGNLAQTAEILERVAAGKPASAGSTLLYILELD